MSLELRGQGGAGQAGYCGRCLRQVPDGVDACVGEIPGVSHACCGHGVVEDAYVVFGGEPDQGIMEIPVTLTLHGEEALAFFVLARRGQIEHHP